jgi:hypothetical protein
MEFMALSKIAEPPSDLHKRKLPLAEVSGPLFRISKVSRGKGGVVHFGKYKTERFDDPLGKFGVCYLGLDDYAAFIEVFGQALEIIIDLNFIHEHAISTLKLKRKVKFVDLTGPGAAWISAAGEVMSGDHALSQRWARELYSHPTRVDGILYRSRHDLARKSVAVFDRGMNLLVVDEYTEWSEPSIQLRLGIILDHYNMAIG